MPAMAMPTGARSNIAASRRVSSSCAKRSASPTRGIVLQVPLKQRGPPGEAVALEAGDALVAVGDGADLLARDHVLDALERPVPGALVDRAQDAVRPAGAVRQHDLVRRPQADRLV